MRSLNNTLNSYNNTAEEYFKNISEFDILPEINTFCSLSKPAGKVLDLGCGPGHHSKMFAEKGFNVIGVDFSIEMIKLAKESTSKAKFKLMDIRDLRFRKNNFDSIWASASLIHIEKSLIPSVLLKLKNFLVSGGIFYLSLKEGIGEEETVDNRYGGVTKFHSYFKMDELKYYLLESKFMLIDIYRIEKRPTYDTSAWIHAFTKKP
jgi:2-polyprenyl-3-methyl-5-hydroxy-6-metoxy-1,4-benzoquinol methylase